MKNFLINSGKYCVIINFIAICITVFTLLYAFYWNKNTFFTYGNIDRCDTLYCFPGMKGGVNVPGRIVKGEIIKIKPYIEPWFLTQYDKKEMIPIYYLFRYVYNDSSFKCIDSIEYADNNEFNYLLEDDFTNLLGVAFLSNGDPVSFTLLLSPSEHKISEQKVEEAKIIYDRFQSYIKRVGKNFDR